MPNAGPRRTCKLPEHTYRKRYSDSDVEYSHIDTKMPYNLPPASYVSERSLLG
jgi:hypothetical protein